MNLRVVVKTVYAVIWEHFPKLITFKVMDNLRSTLRVKNTGRKLSPFGACVCVHSCMFVIGGGKWTESPGWNWA